MRFVRQQRYPALRAGQIVVTPALFTLLVLLLVSGVVGMAMGTAALRSARAAEDDTVRLSLAPTVSSSRPATLAVDAVEMPDLAGMEPAEATTLLSAAGLAVSVQRSNQHASGGVARVVSQSPAPGVLVEAGQVVRVVVESSAEDGDAASALRRMRGDYVVCIDPGHQSRTDSTPEPVGPGSKRVKSRASGGATGVMTGVPEYEVALQISMNLKRRLEERGIRVVMTRTTGDVNLSNVERARTANQAKADLFVRVHAAGSPRGEDAGVRTFYPQKNQWTGPIAGRSKRAARRVHQAVLAQTDAVDRKVHAAGDMTGFNWSKVPVLLIETGYLSNSVEDRLLVSPHYQDDIAEGIAGGVAAYLVGEERP